MVFFTQFFINLLYFFPESVSSSNVTCVPILVHLMDYTLTLFVVIITIIFLALTFVFCKYIFKPFVSLECKSNKPQFVIRISSIVISINATHLYGSLYLQQNFSEEIHPGATPFSRVKGFRVFPSKHWCLSSLPQQMSFQKLP